MQLLNLLLQDIGQSITVLLPLSANYIIVLSLSQSTANFSNRSQSNMIHNNLVTVCDSSESFDPADK